MTQKATRWLSKSPKPQFFLVCKVTIIIAADNFSHHLPSIAFREFTWFEKPTHCILYSANLDSQDD